ncbi:P2Y purinoceptor 4-like, partial [Silurus meridionalis]
HLAISDLLLCPLAPFLTVYFALGRWLFGSLICRFMIILLTTHFYGSIYFLTLISIHRYVSVVYHSQEFRMKQKDFVKKLCVGVWVVLLIQGVVCSSLLDTSIVGNRTLCLSIYQEEHTEKYFVINFALLLPGFLIPFIVSLVCYIRLAKSVSGINLCHHKGRLMKSKSRKMVAICLLIFGLCFMPINVIRTVLVVLKKINSSEHCHLLSKVETSYYLSWILSSANCCLDPLIYCFASQNFMAAFRSSLRKIGMSTQFHVHIYFSLSKMKEQTTMSCPPQTLHISLTIILCVVFLIGLVLNGFSLWVFIFRISKWHAGTVLQFNLAISDALAAPATPMMAVYFINGNNWEFGTFLCKMKIALIIAHFYGSIFFLTLISIHRYVVVVHFKRSSRMKRKEFVKKLCFGVWCFLLAGGILYGILLPVTDEDGHKQCLSIHQSKHTSVYFTINFVLFVFGFLLPFTVSVICYSFLVRSVAQVNVNSLQGQSIKTKSIRMIGMCLVIFGLCFFPLNVTRTVAVIIKKYFPKNCQFLLRVEMAYYVSYVLAGINCCLDPLVYFFGSYNFNKAF